MSYNYDVDNLGYQYSLKFLFFETLACIYTLGFLEIFPASVYAINGLLYEVCCSIFIIRNNMLAVRRAINAGLW